MQSMFILCTLAPRIDDFLTMYPILSLSLPFIPVRENHVVSALTLNVRNLLFAPLCPKFSFFFSLTWLVRLLTSQQSHLPLLMSP